MPKRRSSSTRSRTPFILGALAALALLVFLAGELYAFLVSDTGRLLVARHLHLGDRARVVAIIGKHLHEGLASAGVPENIVHEDVLPGDGGPRLRWRIELPRDGAPMKVNYAVTRAMQQCGAVVLSGRERPGEDGALTVAIVAGLPGRPTHELLVTRPGHPKRTDDTPPPAMTVSLVLFGFDDPAAMKALLERPEPFAVAVPAVGESREMVLRAARREGREFVLQIPMEPEKYPRVNPGPGTLLVTMSAGTIESRTREYLEHTPGTVAVANLMGSFATQDEPFMTAMYRELKHAGIPFLHVSPAPRSVCRTLAASMGVGYDEPDEILDGEARAAKPEALERAWRARLERAERRGRTLLWLRVTPLSAKWLAHALDHPAKGMPPVVIAPVSEMVHKPGEL